MYVLIHIIVHVKYAMYMYMYTCIEYAPMYTCTYTGTCTCTCILTLSCDCGSQEREKLMEKLRETQEAYSETSQKLSVVEADNSILLRQLQALLPKDEVTYIVHTCTCILIIVIYSMQYSVHVHVHSMLICTS